MEALFYVNEEIKKGSIIIYGTEAMGKACLKELLNNGVDIEGFCSTILQESGTIIEGKKVISLEELLLMESRNIIITVEDYENIYFKLKEKTKHNIFMYRNVYNVCLM